MKGVDKMGDQKQDIDTAICPKCGHDGEVDASPHVYFKEGENAYRCRECMNVWKAIAPD